MHSSSSNAWNQVASNDDYCGLMPKITYTVGEFGGSYCNQFRLDLSCAPGFSCYVEVSGYLGDDGIEGEVCDNVDVDGMFGVSFCKDGIAAFAYDEPQSDLVRIKSNDTTTLIYTVGKQKYYSSSLYLDIVLDHPDGLFEGQVTSRNMEYLFSLFEKSQFYPFFGDLEMTKTEADDIINYNMQLKLQEAFICDDSWPFRYGYFTGWPSEVGWYETCFMSYDKISMTHEYYSLSFQEETLDVSFNVSKHDLDYLGFSLSRAVTSVVKSFLDFKIPESSVNSFSQLLVEDDSFSYVMSYVEEDIPLHHSYCGNFTDNYWQHGSACPSWGFCDYSEGSYGRTCISCQDYDMNTCESDARLNARGKEDCKSRCVSGLHYKFTMYDYDCDSDYHYLCQMTSHGYSCGVSSPSSFIQCSADGQYFNATDDDINIVNGKVDQCISIMRNDWGYQRKSEIKVSCSHESFEDGYRSMDRYFQFDDPVDTDFKLNISMDVAWKIENSEGLSDPASKRTQIISDLHVAYDDVEVELEQNMESILYNDDTRTARVSLSIDDEIIVSGEAYGLTRLSKLEDVKFAHMHTGFIKIEKGDWSLMIFNASEIALKDDGNDRLQIGMKKASSIFLF